MNKSTLYRTQAGDIIHNEIKEKSNYSLSMYKRKNREKPSREAVMNENNNIAAKKLAILLDANFKENDLYITLTYREKPTHEEAGKHIKKFIAAIRNACKKQGKQFKWIYTSGRGSQRPHHHIVMSKIDLDIISKYWPYGFTSNKPLSQNDYSAIAWYFIKHTRDEYNRDNEYYKWRYHCSRNLERPETEKININYMPNKDLTPTEGYKIIKESINIRINPITGLRHISYREVRIHQEEPYKKIRKMRNSKIIKGLKYYNLPPEEEQMAFV